MRTFVSEKISSDRDLAPLLKDLPSAANVYTLQDYQAKLDAQRPLVLHISGKGNFDGLTKNIHELKGVDVLKNNSALVEIYAENQSRAIQALDELKQHAQSDAQRLHQFMLDRVKKVERTSFVVTFDGDNYQPDSPFTFIVKYFIEQGDVQVFALKNKLPSNPKHKDSWEGALGGEYPTAMYTGMVLVDTDAWLLAGAGKGMCNFYLSYGLPLVESIPTAQKDSEMEVEQDAVDPTTYRYSKDKFGRTLFVEGQPGLVVSAISREGEKVAEYFTRIDHPLTLGQLSKRAYFGSF